MKSQLTNLLKNYAMKKIILFLLFTGFFSSLSAQKVALHSPSGVQFFTGSNGFVEAVNEATSGDTLYLPGGGFPTNSITIDKQLLIFGAGHYPDSTAATSTTILNGYINLSDNADSIHFEGVDILGGLSTTSNHAVNHIMIKYCRIQGELNIRGDQSNPALNLVVTNSVVTGTVRLTNAQNAGIFNSLFNTDIYDTNGNLFKNNIFFLNNYSVSTYRYTIYGNNNTIENNIFLRIRDREIMGNSNILRNNLTPKETPFWGTTPIASDNHTGVAVETIFVNQTGNVFDYTHNYHLQSPETYLGTDGAQVGIYGGLFPYKEGAVPSNPHIYLKNIGAETDDQGQLQIQIGVKAQTR